MSDQPVGAATRSPSRVARITLDRPERGNGITRELVSRADRLRVERADLDPAVHVMRAVGRRAGLLRRL